jgi:hypothetical protein
LPHPLISPSPNGEGEDEGYRLNENYFKGMRKKRNLLWQICNSDMIINEI